MDAATSSLQMLDAVYQEALRFLPGRKPLTHHRILRSEAFITFSIPSFCTELGKWAFSFSAPPAWSTLQQDVKLSSLTYLGGGGFKLILKTMEKRDRNSTLHFYLIVQYCSDELV